MKREWVLLVVVVGVTLLLTLGSIRYFAPQLLNIPVDLQTVRVSKEVPPFYENVFRKEDHRSGDFLLKDPYTNVRARPLYYDVSGRTGPHDVLGFRNSYVPDVADIVTIGDSQTYGNNAALPDNWPSQLGKRLRDRSATVYNMAVGGWSAVQYQNMVTYASVFLPRVVIVAFYSGNDPQESVLLAYADERWAPLRPEARVDITSIPPSPGFPPAASEQWEVRFRDGSMTTFVPALRLVSNDSAYETVRAGYQIMEKAARLMATTAQEANFRLVFTIIPTKELVYAEKLRRDGISPKADYEKLVVLERENIDRLAQSFRALTNVEYVDLVVPLQKAALGTELLYPQGVNGHPLPAGYRVVAEALESVIKRHVSYPPRGLIAIDRGNGRIVPMLVNREGVWNFGSKEIMAANGWMPNDELRRVELRDIVSLPARGMITVVDPGRFGPDSMR
jgi:lysophospholipase L1-like esterase